MAYTRLWADVLNVPGSRDADEIDDAFRETKVDFAERLPALVVDVAADPWVPISGALGRDRLHAFAGNAVGLSIYNPTLGAVTPSAAGNTGLWYGSIPLRRDLHVKSVLFYVFGGDITAKVFRVNSALGTAPVEVMSGTSAIISTGASQIVLGVMDEIVATTRDLFFTVTIPGNGVDVNARRFYGLEVELVQL